MWHVVDMACSVYVYGMLSVWHVVNKLRIMLYVEGYCVCDCMCMCMCMAYWINVIAHSINTNMLPEHNKVLFKHDKVISGAMLCMIWMLFVCEYGMLFLCNMLCVEHVYIYISYVTCCVWHAVCIITYLGACFCIYMAWCCCVWLIMLYAVVCVLTCPYLLMQYA